MNFIKRLILVVSAIFFFNMTTYSQTPFDCDGRVFMTQVLEDDQTTLNELLEDNQNINIIPFPNISNENINSIGYRQTDNFIYGIDPTKHELYRLDATGQVETVAFVPLNDAYYAGDITPDGDFLVLFNSNFIAKINLNSVESPVEYTPVVSLDSSLVFCTDIAFNPLTQELFGYDAIGGKLVLIDHETGIVDNQTYVSIGYNSTLPALFFNAIGELFGIGTDNIDDSSIIFKFDLETGLASRSFFSNIAGDRDACSCPYTIALREYTTPVAAYPCTTVDYVYKFANLRSKSTIQGSLFEELPTDFIIEEIISPFGGIDNSSIGSNILSIIGMEVPFGVDSMIVKVMIPEGISGIKTSQAVFNTEDPLTNEALSISSDYLYTFEKDDATIIEILSLDELNNNNFSNSLELCENDSIFLQLPDITGLNYQWNTGETTPTLAVTNSGFYEITITSPCEEIIESVEVSNSNIEVDFDESLEVTFGDVVILEPEITTITPIIDYHWEVNIGFPIECDFCSTIKIEPQQDILYRLSIENEAGCTAYDEINILVNRPIFSPNAFTPNFDGINDVFFVYSAGEPIQINYFRILDRWGNLIFEQRNGQTNEETYGWNGNYKNQKMPEGLYIWLTELEYPDGKKDFLSGDILLLR